MKPYTKKILSLILLIVIILTVDNYFNNKKTFDFYCQIYNEGKNHECSQWIDYYRKGEDMPYICKPTKPYEFTLKIDIGKYDSIYFFGEYPPLYEVKRQKLDAYNAYKKYYSDIFANINSYLSFMNYNYYVLYAAYKNGNVTFIKTKYKKNKVIMHSSEITIKNNDTVIVHCTNWRQRDGSILIDVYLSK